MAGRGGARPNSGPKRGSKHKKTIERELLAARQRDETKLLEETAIEAKAQELISARKGGKRLGRELLSDLANVLMGMAAFCQPTPPTMPDQNPYGDEPKFLRLAEMAGNMAAKAAPYESPTFRAIALATEDPNKAEPVRFIVENGPMMIDAVAEEITA